MEASAKTTRPRGFTLVEMLVVIVIIGILASLITGAVIGARRTVKNAAIKMEIEQLQGALQKYKTLYGEYPPDFAFVTNTVDDDLRNASQDAVIRHLKRRFPRYQIDAAVTTLPDDDAWLEFVADLTAEYSVDPDSFDPGTALTFWLGGLPEVDDDTILAGFHADGSNPFRTGIPRDTESRLFDFNPASLRAGPGYWHCIAQSGGSQSAPYVYFRSHRLAASTRYEYGEVKDPSGAPTFEPSKRNFTIDGIDYGTAVPYMDTGGSGDPAVVTSTRYWQSSETFQVIHPGLDGMFGATNDFRDVSGTGFDENDFDNLASFTTGTLEDDLP